MSLQCSRCQHENEDGARFCLQCGNMLEQPAEAGGDPLVGRIIADRYRIVSLLGEGGMGRVYLAEQKMGTATRKVAIKTLHPELSRDAQLVQRFHRECETVIALSHPNTVQFYDFGELPEGTLYIVMEYIEGESLANVLQRGPLEPGRVDRILVQICGSLQEAHDHGIVHRDLKPENILLTRRGGQNDFVKVLDFGIAKRTEAEDDKSQKLTKQGMVLGTPPYMSPEQFAGKTLDARSDIYSLGVMTYEMLTGRLPFEAATPWEWATKHLTTPPTPFEQHPVGASIPDFKKAAVMRALAKDPAQRFASATEFMQAFTGIADSESAWALVTHLAARPSQQQGQPSMPPGGMGRGPAPTPGPMPQAASWNTGTGAGAPSGGFGPHPSMATGGAYVTGSAPARSGSGLKVMLLVFGGLGALGIVGVVLLFALVGGEPDEPTPVRPTPIAKADGTGGSDTGSNSDRGPSKGQGGVVPEAPGDSPDPVPSAGSQGTKDSGGQDAPGTAPTQDELPGASSDEAMPAEARRHLERARRALGAGRVADAARHLKQAISAGAPKDAREVASMKRRIAARGANKVGLLLVRNRCAEAQQLYRALRSVGAHRRAGGQFASGWCPRP